jgi:hypothetical protein
MNTQPRKKSMSSPCHFLPFINNAWAREKFSIFYGSTIKTDFHPNQSVTAFFNESGHIKLIHLLPVFAVAFVDDGFTPSFVD